MTGIETSLLYEDRAHEGDMLAATTLPSTLVSSVTARQLGVYFLESPDYKCAKFMVALLVPHDPWGGDNVEVWIVYYFYNTPSPDFSLHKPVVITR